jgi:hypothetical protein
MITERYRKDYTGEFIILNTAWSGGKKRTQREWMPNPVENHHISGRAACIGSAADKDNFDFTMLQNHKGGLLGSKKLQTYGVGDIAKTMRLDFAIEKDDTALHELFNLGYYKNNIIYTTPKQCIKHPGVFYVIPYNPPMVREVALAYIAAFDGHKEVFLLGYHEGANIGQSEWVNQMSAVIGTYSSTHFYHVSYSPQTPNEWKNFSNFSQLTYREFISYADV